MVRPIEKAPLLCSQRLILTAMMFFGNIFVYSARVNLSVAILCMVRNDVSLNMTSSNQDDINSTNVDGNECGGDVFNQSRFSTPRTEGEFDWDRTVRSNILSMYFYGYIFTQIPGGWLATRFGGKKVWGVCMFVSAVCCLLTPMSARVHVYFIYAIRFILGFSAGVTYPCLHALLGRWAPIYERSKLTASAHAGNVIGLVLTFAISGVLCESGFDNGWGSIFYLTGIFYMIWVVLWFLLTADSPEEHPRIMVEEKEYILRAIDKGVTEKTQKVPWLAIFKSVPVWAIVIAHACVNYTTYTLLTSLPTFMKEALKFDIKQNGILSAVPYVTNCLGIMMSGYMADIINERGWLKIVNQRKLFQTICFLGTGGFLCIACQLDCSQRYWVVVILCMATTVSGFSRAAFLVNHLDLTPGFAGVTYGISNTAATIPGMITPVIAGALTPNKTHEEWRQVFYVCGAVCVVGAILYCLLAEGELQEWAKGKPTDQCCDLEGLYEDKKDGKTINTGLVQENGSSTVPLAPMNGCCKNKLIHRNMEG